MSYFDYEGNRIFYEEIGDGKPLILLHGNTASSKMLENFVAPYNATVVEKLNESVLNNDRING